MVPRSMERITKPTRPCTSPPPLARSPSWITCWPRAHRPRHPTRIRRPLCISPVRTGTPPLHRRSSSAVHPKTCKARTRRCRCTSPLQRATRLSSTSSSRPVRTSTNEHVWTKTHVSTSPRPKETSTCSRLFSTPAPTSTPPTGCMKPLCTPPALWAISAAPRLCSNAASIATHLTATETSHSTGPPSKDILPSYASSFRRQEATPT
mmetsp:Transcript_6288/g.13774  ORF Transcript_6288/g.13774 Transcript_6288/m.13774 type:complete len:207 (-) Transcript_6288:131-751(-)